MISRVKEKIEALHSSLDNIKEMFFHNLVKWDNVSESEGGWIVGEERCIGDSINLKMFEDENIIIFKTTIAVGGMFPSHWHDFAETLFVIRGLYEDSGKVVSSGSWVTNKKNIVHFVKNIGDTPLEMIVTFTKD